MNLLRIEFKFPPPPSIEVLMLTKFCIFNVELICEVNYKICLMLGNKGVINPILSFLITPKSHIQKITLIIITTLYGAAVHQTKLN